MKQGYVKSSPRFFRMITTAMLTLAVLLLALAAFIPAPLQTAADPAATPNPVKSAWFLLWIQELVSWSRYMIWPVLLLGGGYLLLPWLDRGHAPHRATWFPKGGRVVAVITCIVFAAIVVLTVIAMLFRGGNWVLV